MQELADRFWPKVDQSGDCWLWTGARGRDGYGRLYAGGRQFRAPRVAWELSQGRPPVGQFVCHRCDNPACVRPEHLFLGSSADNVADRHAKGRDARGERNGGGKKLSADQVLEIRRRRRLGETQCKLAEAFGISQQMVSRIARGEIWKEQP